MQNDTAGNERTHTHTLSLSSQLMNNTAGKNTHTALNKYYSLLLFGERFVQSWDIECSGRRRLAQSAPETGEGILSWCRVSCSFLIKHHHLFLGMKRLSISREAGREPAGRRRNQQERQLELENGLSRLRTNPQQLISPVAVLQ